MDDFEIWWQLCILISSNISNNGEKWHEDTHALVPHCEVSSSLQEVLGNWLLCEVHAQMGVRVSTSASPLLLLVFKEEAETQSRVWALAPAVGAEWGHGWRLRILKGEGKLHCLPIQVLSKGFTLSLFPWSPQRRVDNSSWPGMRNSCYTVPEMNWSINTQKLLRT